MLIKGTADISGATLLDGGNSTDGSVTDILGTAGAATNKLTFQGTTQSVAGSMLKNWQTVTLDGSRVTFAGDAALVTGTGTNSDSSQQGLVLKNASTLASADGSGGSATLPLTPARRLAMPSAAALPATSPMQV